MLRRTTRAFTCEANRARKDNEANGTRVWCSRALRHLARMSGFAF